MPEQLNAIKAFNTGFSNDHLIARPKSMRLEQEDFHPAPHPRRLLLTVEYDDQRRALERCSYRDNGTLTYRTVYDHAEGVVTVFTSDGQPVQQSRTTKSLDDRTEEVVTTSFTGAPPSITRTTFDNDRRVLCSVIIDSDGAINADHFCQYNPDGSLASSYSKLIHADGSITRIESSSDASGALMWSCYGAGGTLLMRSHTSQTETERICQQDLISDGKTHTTTRREKMEPFDQHGNWTQLTIFEGHYCVARIHRIIAYYPAN